MITVFECDVMIIVRSTADGILEANDVREVLKCRLGANASCVNQLDSHQPSDPYL